ncbi:hypothetical protein [Terasakiella pusilla]|uniref:hypothetical protein n=1 Tax=Terasakiella pusilla TaxID=64973 RepID=UPI0005710D58|nr:hypothetical protein [Terasakiella pusilla]
MDDEHILAIPGAGTCPQPTDIHEASSWMSYQVDQLNLAVKKLVDAGATIELVRTSRYHNGTGNWGDQFRTHLVKENR